MNKILIAQHDDTIDFLLQSLPISLVFDTEKNMKGFEYLSIEYINKYNAYYVTGTDNLADGKYITYCELEEGMLYDYVKNMFNGTLLDWELLQTHNRPDYLESLDSHGLRDHLSARDLFPRFAVDLDDSNKPSKYDELVWGRQPTDLQEETSRGFSEEVSQYLTDMKILASKGEYTKVIGRDNELDVVVKSLSRFKKGNPMLVGESGVGKSAIAEGLAQLLAEGSDKLPEHLKTFNMYELEVGKLMAGARYRGDLEQRVTDIFSEINDQGNTIVFIDEIHTIKGKKEEALDIGNLLKTYLTKTNVRVVGATTYKEFKNFIEKDPALPRRFQKVEVIEPSVEDCYEILDGVKDSYEKYHNVKFDTNVVNYIVDKGNHYITKGFMPDKVLDVMDLVGTSVKMQGRDTVTKEDVNKVISDVARIPLDTLQSTGSVLKTLKANINNRVFGQEHVVDTVERLIKVSKMCLGDKNKPVASLLFTGSSGTGKTELCKAMADTLGLKLCKFDMSEYSDQTAVNKLVGANSGYVGYEEGGLLTETVMKNPSSVVLLDEIEKAHPSVYTTLLQVMDEGKLTDNQGRVADFKNVIFVMTSNVGAAAVQEVGTSIGFLDTSSQDKVSVQEDSLKAEFPPEFRNRLDALCTFNDLTNEVLESITTKFVKQVEVLAEDQGYNIEFSFDKKAMKYFVEHGFVDGMGARPMARLVSDKLKVALSDLMIDEQLVKGTQTTIVVTIKNDDVVLKVRELETV